MYEAFFNLKNKPFSLLPDPDFLFLSSRHAIGLSLLEYSLTGQAGFCVITGEIGSGKTTLVRAFLGRVGRDFTVGLISNTHHGLKDIAAWSLAAFGQKANGTHPSETYQQLMEYLIAEYGAGRQCILIVDEAQNLSIEVLEELRLLSNINSGKDLLLQIVLVGQPELLEKLRRPELSQFAQRIAVSHHLTPLPYAETRRYIEHRVKVAGSDRPLFTEMAMGAIQYFSGGIPRLINSICDMALVYGFADETPVIGEDLVFRVVSDRQLSGIAPFAQAVPVDDSALRAEIMKLANLGPAASQPPAPTQSDAPKGDAAASQPGAALAPAATEPAAAAVPEPADAGPKQRPAGKMAATGADPVAIEEPRGAQAQQREIPARLAPSPKPSARAFSQQDVSMREAAAGDAPSRAIPRTNPYFFREVEDDEELLLTREMSDSSRNAHKHGGTAPRSTSLAAAQEHLVDQPAAMSDASTPALRADLAPNQAPMVEEAGKSIVEPMPWPSINERRPGSPIPAKENGTGALPRRSWWRRSIGRSS
jgi:type II secretory pathway predicted ATPase ExeA